MQAFVRSNSETGVFNGVVIDDNSVEHLSEDCSTFSDAQDAAVYFLEHSHFPADEPPIVDTPIEICPQCGQVMPEA